MEKRLTVLETKLESILPNLATKSDLERLSSAMAEVKSVVAESETRSAKLVLYVAAGAITLIISVLSFMIKSSSPVTTQASQPTQPVVIVVPSESSNKTEPLSEGQLKPQNP